MKYRVFKNIGMAAAISAALAGCSTEYGVEGSSSWLGQLKSKVAPLTVIKPVQSSDHKTLRQTVYFGFDNSRIASDDQQVLSHLVDYLNSDEASRLQISGHTDERGSSEYNIALGWRRAQSVSNFLQSAGIGKERIDLISYGKEKPLDVHHNESAWQKNRRVELRTIS